MVASSRPYHHSTTRPFHTNLPFTRSPHDISYACGVLRPTHMLHLIFRTFHYVLEAHTRVSERSSHDRRVPPLRVSLDTTDSGHQLTQSEPPTSYPHYRRYAVNRFQQTSNSGQWAPPPKCSYTLIMRAHRVNISALSKSTTSVRRTLFSLYSDRASNSIAGGSRSHRVARTTYYGHVHGIMSSEVLPAPVLLASRVGLPSRDPPLSYSGNSPPLPLHDAHKNCWRRRY